MKWDEIDITPEKPELDPFVAIGNGRIKISKGACKLIKDFDKCNYVTFLRAKRDRIIFAGLRFGQTETNTSLRIDKDEDGEFGAIIYAKDVVETLYGEEGKSTTYTKRLIDIDPEYPNILVIHYNYKKQYSILNDIKEPIRQKHIGTIVDKEWKVISCFNRITKNDKKAPMYRMQNMNTGEQIDISCRALNDIKKGLTSVDNLKLARKIGIGSYLGKKRAEKKRKIKLLNKE